MNTVSTAFPPPKPISHLQVPSTEVWAFRTRGGSISAINTNLLTEFLGQIGHQLKISDALVVNPFHYLLGTEMVFHRLTEKTPSTRFHPGLTG